MKGVHSIKNSLSEDAILNLVRSGISTKGNLTQSTTSARYRGNHPQGHYQSLFKNVSRLESHMAFGNCQFKFQGVVIAAEHQGGLTVTIPTRAFERFTGVLHDFILKPYSAKKSRATASKLVPKATRYWSGTVSDDLALEIVFSLVEYYSDNKDSISKDIPLRFMPNLHGALATGLTKVGIYSHDGLKKIGYLKAFNMLKKQNSKISDIALIKLYACVSGVLYQSLSDSDKKSIMNKYYLAYGVDRLRS